MRVSVHLQVPNIHSRWKSSRRAFRSEAEGKLRRFHGTHCLLLPPAFKSNTVAPADYHSSGIRRRDLSWAVLDRLLPSHSGKGLVSMWVNGIGGN